MIIDKVLTIWENLDSSYEKSGAGLTKLEYLTKILGYKDDLSCVDNIKFLLTKERETYTNEYIEKYQRLCDKLVLAFELLENSKDCEISINSIESALVAKQQGAMEPEKVLIDYEYLNTFRNSDLIDPAIAINDGFLVSRVMCRDGKITNYEINNTTAYYRSFSDRYDVMNFVGNVSKALFMEDYPRMFKVMYAYLLLEITSKEPKDMDMVFVHYDLIKEHVGQLELVKELKKTVSVDGQVLDNLNGEVYKFSLDGIEAYACK